MPTSVQVSTATYALSLEWLALHRISDYTVIPTVHSDLLTLAFGYRPHCQMYLYRWSHLGAQKLP